MMGTYCLMHLLAEYDHIYKYNICVWGVGDARCEMGNGWALD